MLPSRLTPGGNSLISDTLRAWRFDTQAAADVAIAPDPGRELVDIRYATHTPVETVSCNRLFDTESVSGTNSEKQLFLYRHHRVDPQADAGFAVTLASGVDDAGQWPLPVKVLDTGDAAEADHP
eukprot:TRINITY_DN56237_c0_g1_i3.p2 TRINITY_DN56237_c0_g1~~TRINITY_DN56237_c0_g1_i3.p2  ORF type:complete len:124 (+),score=7.00 TRINITY_DN56237_c0_g1_i3:59-430(+)